MATLTAPRAASSSLVRPEISSPLAKLQRAIRGYVVLEGLALAAIWACAWLWATFLIDWGMFRLFGVDYIRDGSDTARIVLRGLFTLTLWGGLAYFLGYKVLYRLLATFNEPALALVLERRFPGVLGDRLVTAVELADPGIAERYGYSEALIEETTRTAAQRVTGLPLGPVFNRGRLLFRGAVASALLLTVILFAVRATNAAAIWFERDVLLQNTYWPRRTVLELPDFADTDTKAVPHGGEFKLNIRALKWVVATKENKEGWRPLTWLDLTHETGMPPPWELEKPLDMTWYTSALPASWRRLTVDQVEARIEALARETLGPEVGGLKPLPLTVEDLSLKTLSAETRAQLDELGQASMAIVRARLKEIESSLPGGLTSELGPAVTSLLPTTSVRLDHLREELRAAERLTPAELERLLGYLRGTRPTATDVAQALNALFCPVTPPILPTVTMFQFVAVTGPGLQLSMFFSPADLEMLPEHWRMALPAGPGFGSGLESLHRVPLAQRYGLTMCGHLRELFDELNARAEQSHVGRRVQFRKLDVPNDVIVEFEQIQTDEERARGKAKRAGPKVRRIPGTNDYVYEFKKIERPLRFRVVAGDDATQWYTIDVKPLPVLTNLTRRQNELGYLHGSNERVEIGPLPVSVEGSDSKFDVPAGTRLRLEAMASKPLRWVTVKQAGQREHSAFGKQLGHALTSPYGLAGPISLLLATVAENQNPLVQKLEHVEDSSQFSFGLRELAAEDVKLVLEFEDADGILGRRPVNIGVLADKEPEFARIGFEIVNRKMITSQAIIPFSGHIRDDHGLVSLIYEATVEKPDRTVVKKTHFPFRRFSPLVTPESSRGGLRFDKREQVTLARTLSAPLEDGSVGDAWLAPLVLGRLPATGLVGLWQPPAVDMPREYIFDYRLRAGSQPVLNEGDEFFDTLSLRAEREQPIQVNGQALPIPYRLVVRVIAHDNRVRTGATGHAEVASQESLSPEAFEFTVVAEEDLLLEAGKREESIHDTAEEVVENLKKQKEQLQKVAAEFPGLQPNEFRRVAADVHDVLKVIREERMRVDEEVAREFRSIYRELVLNRCTEQVLSRIDQRICRPLETILLPGMEFARTDEALDRLARLLEADKDQTPRDALSAGVNETDNLIRRLEDIIKEMKKLMEFNKALQALREIIKTQEDINRLIKEKFDRERSRELDDKP
jgi:hypothetical protein